VWSIHRAAASRLGLPGIDVSFPAVPLEPPARVLPLPARAPAMHAHGAQLPECDVRVLPAGSVLPALFLPSNIGYGKKGLNAPKA